jgi:hypothetical protein
MLGSTRARRKGRDNTTGADLGVGGEHCWPDTVSGDYGEVLERRRLWQLHGGESLRSRDKPASVLETQSPRMISWSGARDWDPSLPFCKNL